MNVSKALSDGGWKDLLGKNKAVKDNGLLKALTDLKRIDETRHDDALGSLGEIAKLVAQLKKTKEAAAVPAVAKFLAEVGSAAEATTKDVVKAKAEADKRSKAEAEAKKQQAKKADADEAEDDEEDASPAILTSKLIPLLRQVNKGESMHVMVARAGKQVAVLLSRKPIAPARRKILADHLGVSGGVKYYTGHCTKENGATAFVLNTQVAGLAKQLKLALLNQTGMRVKKIACRGEDGDDTDDDDAVAEAPAKPGQKPDVPADAKAADAGAARVEPAPAALMAAPQAWDGMRNVLDGGVKQLKQAIRQQYASESPALLAEIEQRVGRVDVILQKLDGRLSQSLERAGATKTAAERKAELQGAKAILADYVAYVKSEPLIDHIDKNPFGVNIQMRQVITDGLKQMIKSIS